MKFLNETEVMNGLPVIHMTAGGTPIVGLVQNTNEQRGYLRVTGYPLPVNPAECVSAADAYNAVAGPIRKAKADAEAKAKAELSKSPEATQENPSPVDPAGTVHNEPPPNPSN